MPDDAAFVRAILANPDDDLPRLIYADALDERGDPRGEFIRAQIDLARLPPDSAERPRLKEREKHLLAEHGTGWAAPLEPFVHGYEFRRGFVDAVKLDAFAFLRHAETLFAAAPVRQVALLHAWEEIDKLALSPALARVRALGLSGNQMSDVDVSILKDSPHLGQLEELDLSFNRLHHGAVEALSHCPSLGRLRVLDLSSNDVGPDGARALAGSFAFGGLDVLSLRMAHIGPAGVEAIAASDPLDRLTSLDLTANPLGARGLRALAHARRLRHLRRLALFGVPMNREQFADLEFRFGKGAVLNSGKIASRL